MKKTLKTAVVCVMLCIFFVAGVQLLHAFGDCWTCEDFPEAGWGRMICQMAASGYSGCTMSGPYNCHIGEACNPIPT